MVRAEHEDTTSRAFGGSARLKFGLFHSRLGVLIYLYASVIGTDLLRCNLFPFHPAPWTATRSYSWPRVRHHERVFVIVTMPSYSWACAYSLTFLFNIFSILYFYCLIFLVVFCSRIHLRCGLLRLCCLRAVVQVRSAVKARGSACDIGSRHSCRILKAHTNHKLALNQPAFDAFQFQCWAAARCQWPHVPLIVLYSTLARRNPKSMLRIESFEQKQQDCTTAMPSLISGMFHKWSCLNEA